MGALILIMGAGSAGFCIMKFAHKFSNVTKDIGVKYGLVAQLLFFLTFSALFTTFVAIVTGYFPDKQEVFCVGLSSTTGAIAIHFRSMHLPFIYLAVAHWIAIMIFVLWIMWLTRNLSRAKTEDGISKLKRGQ